MNIAFLFNSDHESLGDLYGYAVMKKLLATRVLQAKNRHMRISVGDILTYSAATQSKTPNTDYLVKLCQAVYSPIHFDRLNHRQLEETHGTATVYCWLFQNMTEAIGEALHSKLSRNPAYLGAMDVAFSKPIHLRFFRNSLCENYRLHGKHCSIFYSMGMNEDPDIGVRNCFRKHGFAVDYEDAGARRTIFDEFYSPEHFQRVEDFICVFASFNDLDTDRASDLALSLEEVHPKLFDALASAARTLARAETEEDYAQAALSGRRILEKIADYLFPPMENKWNGRKVGCAEYKNRLWAYIEQTVTASNKADSSLTILGKEADRLVELFNSGLHATPTKAKIEAAFVSLITWLSDVIALSPAAARRPYLAYEDPLLEFIEEVVRDRPQ